MSSTQSQVPLTELTSRMLRFRATMDAVSPEWEAAAIFSKVNLYYLTGTMPDGLLLIPVLAEGFDDPLQENMVFAVEPKKGIANVGMVGIENTFVVTPQGGRCLTGNNPGLILVKE